MDDHELAEADTPSPALDRRKAIGLGLTAAVASLAAVVGADSASAASGENLVLGQAHDGGVDSTSLTAHNASGTLNVQSSDGETTSASVNLAFNGTGVVANGATGVAATGTTTGLTASGPTALSASGTTTGITASAPTALVATGTTTGISASGVTGLTASGTTAVNASGSTTGVNASGPTAVNAVGTQTGVVASGGSGYGVNASGSQAGVHATGPVLGVFADGAAAAFMGIGSQTGGWLVGTGASSQAVLAVSAPGDPSGPFPSVVKLGQSNGVAGAFTGDNANLLLTPGAATSPPNVLHAAGEIFVGSDVGILVCVAGGTPGTWVRLGLNPLTPVRVCDTRPGSGKPFAGQTLGQGSELTISFPGTGGVPAAGASSVVFNLTMATCTADGWLTAYPTGAGLPDTSNLNFAANQSPKANLVVVKLGTGGSVTINNAKGSTNMIVDLFGFYS